MLATQEKMTKALRKQIGRAAQSSAEAMSEMGKAAELAQAAEGGEAPETPGPPEKAGEVVEQTPGDAEWRRLARMTQIPWTNLQRSLSTPYECRLVVIREQPQQFEGQEIPCGEFPEFSQDWPFDLNGTKAAIAAKYGGKTWRLSIQDNTGRVIRDIPFRLAADPKDPNEISREDLEEVVGAGQPGAASPRVRPDMLEEFDEIAQLEKQRARVVGLRAMRKAMEDDAHGAGSRNDDLGRKLDALIEASSKKNGNGDASNIALVLQAIQAQASNQAESLKMVVAGLGDKLSHQSDSQLQMFKMMAEMMKDRASSQAEITKIQMEAKKSETDLLVKMMGEQRAEKEMNIDKVLELIQMGINMKGDGGGGGGEGDEEGEGKNDWLATLVGSLGTLISGQATQGLKIPAQEPGLPSQPVLTPEEVELRRKIIETEAQKAAANIVARERARHAALRQRQQAAAAVQRTRSAPAGAAAEPISADKAAAWKGLVTEILETVILELDELPAQSEAVKLAFEKAPPEWRVQLATNDSARALGAFFQPFADPALLAKIQEDVGENLAAKQWLMTQAGILRGACIRQMQQAQQAAPAEAATPAAPPSPPAPPVGGPANA